MLVEGEFTQIDTGSCWFPICAWKLKTRIHALPDLEEPTRCGTLGIKLLIQTPTSQAWPWFYRAMCIDSNLYFNFNGLLMGVI